MPRKGQHWQLYHQEKDQYYYQCQQQIFTVERQYCDFVLLGMMEWQHLCIKGFCQTQITGQK